jgi:hypothetical protein
VSAEPDQRVDVLVEAIDGKDAVVISTRDRDA